jgi:uncharacterized repeat protein (TIGR03803 family)
MMIRIGVANTYASVLVLAVFGAMAPIIAYGQTLTTLYGFAAEPDGGSPEGAPVLFKGALYGTTNTGGVNDQGSVYKLNPRTGAETIVYSFGGGADGAAPEGDLIEHGGVFYGTTSFGGTFNAGTVFKVDAATGAESVIYSFGSGQDGASPVAGLLYHSGKLYGTTVAGGTQGDGTVFVVDPATGSETVLHSFAAGDDGSQPFAGVTYIRGALYGTTGFGGAANVGTIFKIGLATGTETVVHAFRGSSFEGNPFAGLVANASVLYGTTSHGGRTKCHGSGCGKVFAFDTASYRYSVLYRFDGFRDGEDPEGGLVYLGGSLYGATHGGRAERGTIFKVDALTGAETQLHDFGGAQDGAVPGTLIYHAGHFYGTTSQESAAGFGTVFEFTE